MNTSKQVNVMIGLMFIFLIGTLLYFVWDEVRADDAEDRQIVENAERGGRLFSLNCRSCHGLRGLGPMENSNLPGLPLNLETNRPDDPGKLLERQSRVLDTIRCGRVGTLMPQWAEDQGGPLNDFQIEQLVALITGAMPGLDPPDNPNAVSESGWEAAVEEANLGPPHGDLLPGKRLAKAVGPADTTFVLTDAQKLSVGGLLRLGGLLISPIDEEVVRIVDAPASTTLLQAVEAAETELSVKDASMFKSGDIVQIGGEQLRVVSASQETLQVERGVGGTDAADHHEGADVFEPGNEITVERAAFATEAAEHDEDTQVFAGPIEPPTSPLTGEDGDAPCGQLGVSAPATPSGEPIPIEGEVTMEMGDNFFQLDGQTPPTLQVAVGQEATINLVNNGQAIHNMHIAGVDNTYEAALCEVGGDEPCSDPSALNPGDTGVITFTFDEAGTFDFRCDFHPVQMIGQVVVVE